MTDTVNRTNSSSSIGRLSSKLGRSRKGSTVNGSDPSLRSDSIGDGDGLTNISSRNSIEGALDKFKSLSRRSSSDKRSFSEGNRLSKLLQRKKGKHNDTDQVDNDYLSAENSPSRDNTSRTSLQSSLLTEGSDQERVPVRPSLSPHQSHSGYLTVSSPQINARTDPIENEAAERASLPLENPFILPKDPPRIPLDDSAIPPPTPPKPKPPARKRVPEKGQAEAEEKDTNSPIARHSQTAALAKESPQRSPRASSKDLPKVISNIDSAPGTPSTFVTPPTPVLRGSKEFQRFSPTKSGYSPPSTKKTFGLGTLTANKQTSITNAPLTPTLEEAKTPGGSLTAPNPGGFFSSVFSAAQTAATQFTNPFAQPPKPKSPLSNRETSLRSIDSTRFTTGSGHAPEAHNHPESIDSGLDSYDPSMTASSENVARVETPKSEDAPAAPSTNTPVSHLRQELARPVSIASQHSVSGEQSPARSSTTQLETGGVQRRSSTRSKFSDRRRSRKRGSSVGTTNTFGNGLAAPVNGHRPTMFAVASSKRNKDFHQLFRSVPEDDYLVEDYSAALQRDILLHGRFYVSEGHICFASNILGWVTNLVIAFDEIILIEKKNTAIVFPNALVIQTHHSRNVFASFVTRDATFDLLLGIWKTTHPNLRVTPNTISLDGPGGSQTAFKEDSSESDDEDSDEGSDDVYDEDAEDEDDLVSVTEVGANGSFNGSDAGDYVIPPRRVATMPAQAYSNGHTSRAAESPEALATGTIPGADFPGPSSHEPTDCSDAHYDRPLVDTMIPVPLGKIYNLWFGPASGAFMRKWLVDDQKSRELVYEDDKIGLDDSHKSFVYSYIKPLHAPVGPKQTKCIVTETLQAFDLERAVTVDCSTQTPDVPSGSIFVTKTRYCLMWGPNDSTRIIATCTIEWSGKSWLKGPIEKGANDGQTQYVKDLVAALRAAVATKLVKSHRTKKGKRKRGETIDTLATDAEEPVKATKAQPDWGLLEPLRSTLSPVTDLVSPLVSTQAVIAVLLLLLAQSWFFPSLSSRRALGSWTGAERVAAYEALWAREEAELWDWLEERTGLDQGMEQRRKVLAKGMVRKHPKMETREAKEALRVVDEKMEALRSVVGSRDG